MRILYIAEDDPAGEANPILASTDAAVIARCVEILAARARGDEDGADGVSIEEPGE